MGHCTSLRRLFGFALAGLLIATAATFLFQARQKSAVNAKADRILVEKAARRLTLFSAGRRLKSIGSRSVSLRLDRSNTKVMAGHQRENTQLIFTSPTAPSIAPCIFPIRMRPTAHERQRRGLSRGGIWTFTVCRMP